MTVAQSSIKSGAAESAIFNVAKEMDIDLIVVGAGETTEAQTFSSGPTAESVIAQAPQPVLAVRPGNPPRKRENLWMPGLEHAENWVQEFDRSLAVMYLSGVEWKRDIRRGTPHEQIVAAQEYRVDVILMGATGRTEFVRALPGSTTRIRLNNQLPSVNARQVNHEMVVEAW